MSRGPWKPPAAKAKPAASLTARLTKYLTLVVLLASLVIGYRYGQSIVRTAPEQQQQQPSSLVPQLRLHPGEGGLGHFSAEHNASLLWGTYRPGVYFGLRSRTAPAALAAGLMWTSVGADGGLVDGAKLRHNCEQDEIERYGFTAHDGRGFGSQPILDLANGLAMDTSFVGTAEGGWAARVAGGPPTSAQRQLGAAGARQAKRSLFLYVSVDDEFAAGGGGGGGGGGRLDGAAPLRAQGPGAAHLEGRVDGLGGFALLAQARRAAGAGESLPLRVWGSASRQLSHFNVADLVRERLSPAARRPRQNGAPVPQGPPPGLDGGVAPGSRLVVLQLEVEPDTPFELELLYVPHGCAGREDAQAAQAAEAGAEWDPCGAALAKHSGPALATELEGRRDRFETQLRAMLGAGGGARSLRGAPLGDEAARFGAAALAAQLGSIGFFYGASKVAPEPGGAGGGETPPAPLMSVVPSRPFFPRGFLWDEGFHQLVVGAWDAALADDILSHWLGLMHEDGWIPREQILGAEARLRVPDEFVRQHRKHANPPTLLLRLQQTLDRDAARGADGAAAAEREEWERLARRLWPKLEAWYAWWLRTQAGAEPHTFRWRGRDSGDGKLNAMTLSSGLDDYPRATTPSATERHVDLLCWVAFFSRLLSQLAARLGMADEAARYAEQHAAQVGSLVPSHWNAAARAFCDWGQHTNDADFVPHVVVKCATRDGAAQVEHAVADPQRPDCPRSHPRFLFPLGDGKGGLLTREKLVPRRPQRPRWVEHLGYVSLFPLMLRLLPPDSEQLLPVIELLRDPKKLWSNYGLRSLSKADAMWYGRQNAPGDEPYWRGPIWVNLNYLALSGLHHYAGVDGPARELAARTYAELRDNLVGNMLAQWARTGYFWEQYDPESGAGQRTHPFNGWSSLALLALAEVY